MSWIKWFTDKQKAWELKDSIVVCFLADGCMAHDHKFQWMGQVISIKPCISEGMKGYQEAEIEIFKTHNSSGDIRDGDLGTKSVIVENGDLQNIKPGLFFYYK